MDEMPSHFGLEPKKPHVELLKKYDKFKELTDLVQSKDTDLATLRAAKNKGEISEDQYNILVEKYAERREFIEGFKDDAINRRTEERDEAMEQSLTDDLTGLANRRAFNQSLDKLLEEFNFTGKENRSNESAVIIFLDIDGFKPFNDMYGHATGDKALVAVADRIQNTIKGKDAAFRFGGDEFVIFLRVPGDQDPEMVFGKVSERLNRDLSVPKINGVTQQLPIKLSLGHEVLLKGRVNVTAAEVTHNADQKMYKHKGENGQG